VSNKRVVYADPPYIGCANKYPEKQEVDHALLIQQLEGYDGWALSASSPSLKVLLPLCANGVRVGAWVKPFCSFKPNVNPAFAWEPVLFKPCRARSRTENTVRDWVSANITLRKGLTGAKPESFCFWLFDLLGLRPSDEFVDMFPGTRAVTKTWLKWRAQAVLC
jgi:hypothetical protein